MKTYFKILLLLLAFGLLSCQGATTPPPSVTPIITDPVVTPTVSYKVYFYNSDNWTAVNAYAWTGNDPNVTKYLGSWPGTAMTSEGDQWYSITVSGVTGSNIIFNAGNNMPQTSDLIRSGDGSYYKGNWYDGNLRASTPQVIVDFGSTTSPLSVMQGGGLKIKIELLPASGLIDADTSYSLVKKSDGSIIIIPQAITSGTAMVDLSTALIGLIDGEVVQLKVNAKNSSGASTATFEYTTATNYPVGFDNSSPHSVADPWMPLGAFVNGGNTYFRIWSPDKSDVKVNIDGTDFAASVLPAFGIYTSVYEYISNGDKTGSTYQFKIGGVAVRDPYGLMIDNTTKKNIVMDMNANYPVGGLAAAPTLMAREDSIIYEVHVRDFTFDTTWGGSTNSSGKYPGMTEVGTTIPSTTIKTGVDHLKELGITHVQLLPVYDFGSTQYNWGYDPVNYNIPEEQYSITPTDANNRVKEFREMVSGFHGNGLRVIMDVVYNHTQGTEMFANITPKYYTGTNLSGVGNALNTGVPMVSRMIRDSLDQWITNYDIDGYRFDLLGIFHTDAVKDWGTFLNTKHPSKNLLLYGEPWNGYATDPEESKKVRLGTVQALTSSHVGVFNGEYRDNIKGDTDAAGKGYIQGATTYKAGVPGIVYGLRGSLAVTASPSTWSPQFAGDPEQTINYASAHDNYCLWDKVVFSNGKTWGTAVQSDKDVAQFGLGILLVSQGIPFIHAGDEFLRTKTTDGVVPFSDVQVRNSYNAPDSINKINWNWKNTNSSTFNKVKDLITFRKSTSNLRLTTKADIEAKIPDANVTTTTAGVIIAKIDASLILILNPSTTLPYTVDNSVLSGTWNKRWSSSESSGTVTDGDTIPVSSLVVYSK